MLLPEFQRDFRWEMDQTYDLFDSLIRDIFIGAVIYGKPGFAMTLRQIDNRPRKGVGSRSKLRTSHFEKEELVRKSQTQNLRIILDGQQRITSLYRALTGADSVYFVFREDLTPEELVAKPLEEIVQEVGGEAAAESLSVCLHDAYQYELDSDEDRRDAVFDASAFAATLDVPTDRHRYLKAYRSAIKKVCRLFNQETLVAFHLLDMTLEKFCVFFERSNSRGIQLSFTDILAAKLYKGFNLRQKLDEFEDSHGFKPNREILVRAIAYLCAEEKQQTLTIDKKAILENLEPADFVRHWDSVTRSYTHTLDHLVKQHFALSPKWLPSENMVIPLMLFHHRIGGFDRIDESRRQFLEFWYWSSVFANRYSTASNEVIIADGVALTQIAAGKRIERRDYFTKLRPLVAEAEDLFSYTKRTSAIYRGVLNLMGYPAKGLLDWRSAQRIDPAKDLDDHHIYPRAYIASRPPLDVDADEAIQLADCVVNRTLLHKNLNIVIGKTPPQVYLAKLGKSNRSLADCLTNHLIPADLPTEPSWNSNFRKFLDHRAAAMMALIERYAKEPLREMEAQHGSSGEGTEGKPGATRLAAGLKTPMTDYYLPLLQALEELGGSAPTRAVITRVGELMKGKLKDVDYAALPKYPSLLRWENTTQFARNSLVDEGLLKKGSPHGIWEITPKGRKHLQTATSGR